MTAAECLDDLERRLDALEAKMDALDELLAAWLPESDEDAAAA